MTSKLPKEGRIEKKIKQALEDFALTFASPDDEGEYWGHDTNLGNCEEEFKLATKALLKILK